MSWDVVSPPRAQVGESPVWDAACGRLYWVDVWGCALHGTTVVALESTIVPISDKGEALEAKPGPDWHSATHRFNDATVDAAGRLIISTMRTSALGAEPTGVLAVRDEGGCRILDQGFWTPNGLAFSPDGATLYVSESHREVQTVWSYEWNAQEGAASSRRVFADFRPLAGRPDGAVVDAMGCYWSVGVGGGEVYRLAPDGELLETIPVPVENPTKVVFGGTDLTTLFYTFMSVNLTAPDPRALAGALFTIKSAGAGLASHRVTTLTKAAPQTPAS